LLLAADAADGAAPSWLARLGVVDEVVPTRSLDGPPPGIGLGPHIAVNLHGRGPQSHRLLAASRPLRLLAFGEPTVHPTGPPWDETEHEVLRWCRLVDSIGGRCDRRDLRLVPGGARVDRPDDAPVVVHPGASSPARRWPPERFAAVVRALVETGRTCLVTGSEAERPLTAAVVEPLARARRAGVASVIDAGGRHDLAGLVRAIRRAPLLISGDTGPAHLATALGTPSVVLFGPTSPARWGPLIDPERHRVLWRARDGHQGDPHGAICDPALLAIDVDDVLAEAQVLLHRADLGASPRRSRLDSRLAG
jgi:hypothetical protein